MIDFSRSTENERWVLASALTLYEAKLRQQHRDTRSAKVRDDVKWQRYVIAELLAAIEQA